MKKVILILAIILFSLNFILQPVSAANNDPTGYPYKNSPKGQVDKWAFYTRNCTSYSAYRASLVISSFHNSMKGPNGNPGSFGNAHNWDNNAKNIGFTVTTTPMQGAIAVWEAKAGNSGSAGHVAYVESVNSNNTFNISEYNWNYGDGNYNTRSNVPIVQGLSFMILGNPTNSCTPPSQGNWTISGNKQCELSQTSTVNGNIIITDSSSLTLKGSAKLNINLNSYKIEVRDNARLFIRDTARIN